MLGRKEMCEVVKRKKPELFRQVLTTRVPSLETLCVRDKFETFLLTNLRDFRKTRVENRAVQRLTNIIVFENKNESGHFTHRVRCFQKVIMRIHEFITTVCCKRFKRVI